MSFGKRLKSFRIAVKKSQKDIEFETQIPQTTLSGWKNDKAEPTALDIMKLASALGVSLSQLLTEEEYDSPKSQAS